MEEVKGDPPPHFSIEDAFSWFPFIRLGLRKWNVFPVKLSEVINDSATGGPRF